MEMKTPEQESRSKANKDLFTIKSVNSYGTADLDTFYDDDSDLKITSKKSCRDFTASAFQITHIFNVNV